MSTAIKNFALDEDGAVTVDWVVLAAFLIGLALAVVNSIDTATEDIAGEIETTLKSDIIVTSFEDSE